MVLLASCQGTSEGLGSPAPQVGPLNILRFLAALRAPRDLDGGGPRVAESEGLGRGVVSRQTGAGLRRTQTTGTEHPTTGRSDRRRTGGSHLPPPRCTDTRTRSGSTPRERTPQTRRPARGQRRGRDPSRTSAGSPKGSRSEEIWFKTGETGTREGTCGTWDPAHSDPIPGTGEDGSDHLESERGWGGQTHQTATRGLQS